MQTFSIITEKSKLFKNVSKKFNNQRYLTFPNVTIAMAKKDA